MPAIRSSPPMASGLPSLRTANSRRCRQPAALRSRCAMRQLAAAARGRRTDTIAFVPDSTPDTSVFRVSSAGGQPEPLTTRAAGESLHRWPQTLRGGQAILFTAAASPGAFDSANIVVQTIPEGTRKIVHRGGYFGRYLPSGHLIYMSNGTVFAAPFDLDRLEMTGQQVPVLEGVQASTGTGGAQLAVSTSGTLVYLAGGELSIEATMSWLDRGGRTTPLRAAASDWSNPSFSPDGHRVAFDVVAAGGGAPDVWVYEWSRDTSTKLTFDAGPDVKPVWTPDSRRIVFTFGPESPLATRRCLRRCPAPHRERNPSCCWLVAPERQVPGVLRAELQDRLRHPDPACGWRRNIRVEDRKAHCVPERPRSEQEPMFSPDGRWLAYYSNESGGQEVYVRPFPGPGGLQQISNGGGTFPAWSRTTSELFYNDFNTQQMMVASYMSAGDSLRVDKPRVWSPGRLIPRPRLRPFALHPDGQRVAIAAVEQDPRASIKQNKVVFLFNFFDELRRLAPSSNK